MYDPLIVDVFIAGHREISAAAKSIPHHSPASLPSPVIATGASASAPAFALDEIAASTEETLTLFDLARSLNTQMSVADAAEVITRHLRRLVPFTLSVLYLYDAESDELVVGHATGEGAAIASGTRVAIGQKISGWVGAHRKSIRNADPILDFGEGVRTVSPRPHSCLATPLLGRERLVGVLSLYATGTNAFTEGHQRIAEVVSRQVSDILASATCVSSANTLPLHDHETGLPNGQRFLQVIQSGTSDSLSYPVAAMMIQFRPSDKSSDIDGLPQRLATEVVGTIRRMLRPPDLLFRLEELELLALLVSTDQEISRYVGNQLRSALGPQRDGSAAFSGVTATVVVSPLCHDARSIERFVRLSRRSTAHTQNTLDAAAPANSETIH
jgi:GGDEF domain-containing protein